MVTIEFLWFGDSLIPFVSYYPRKKIYFRHFLVGNYEIFKIKLPGYESFHMGLKASKKKLGGKV